ncbi:MAG: agmatinase [Actinomycetia bacterium]|nr:agmatinase [Actinomycetes bacterium]
MPTFLGAAARPATDLGGASAAVVGIPFDTGTHPTRVGSRLGPAAIREASGLVMPNDPLTRRGIDLASLADVGDAEVSAGDIGSLDRAEEMVGAVLDQGARPVVLGGDGLISLPALRATGRRHAGLAVVHLDAHTDTYPIAGFNTATTFSRAADDGVIDPGASCHVGVRGTTLHPEAWSHPRDLGFTVIPMADCRARGLDAVAEEIRQLVAGRPAWLSVDTDVFDPSVAPGVCTPAWEGFTAAEGLGLVDALADIEWIGFDNQTVSPPHDVGDMTALLAATVAARFLLGTDPR